MSLRRTSTRSPNSPATNSTSTRSLRGWRKYRRHDFLTLGMATGLLWFHLHGRGLQGDPQLRLNKLRFPAPLRVGARFPMGVELAHGAGVNDGVQAIYRLTYEVDGQPKPCCVANLVYPYYF
jgi:acyl dehydratase